MAELWDSIRNLEIHMNDETDAIHGDVPALRRGEVVHDFTEAAQ